MRHPATGKASREQPAAARQVVVFLLADEAYAVDLLRVREFIEPKPVTPLPAVPPFVLGVINHKGVVVPVIDLRVTFGLERREAGRQTVVVIVEVGGRLHGLVVDEVREVVRFEAEALRPAPSFAARIREDFISAMAELDGRIVTLLDLERVLSPAELLASAGGEGR